MQIVFPSNMCKFRILFPVHCYSFYTKIVQIISFKKEMSVIHNYCMENPNSKTVKSLKNEYRETIKKFKKGDSDY